MISSSASIQHATREAARRGFKSLPAYVAHLVQPLLDGVPLVLPAEPSADLGTEQIDLRLPDVISEALHTAASDTGLELRVYISRLLMR